MYHKNAARNYFEQTKEKVEGLKISFYESSVEPLSLSPYSGHIDEGANTHEFSSP